MKKVLFYLLLLLFSSCKEENQQPICVITSPGNNSEFLRGDSITILVEASDPDGLIRQVGLYMDEDSLTTITRLPYAYKFETYDITAGQYLIKASAINVEGIEASDSRNITIHPILLVLTAGITDISETSALSGGTIKDDGGSLVTARGICWSTSPGASLADNITTNGSDIGSFTSEITGLSPGTTYYVRAYASNSNETSYGMEYSFTSYTGSVTDYDGNVYPTIEIGSQNWMGENLKNTHLADGTELRLVEDWPGAGGLSYCWYDNDISNKDIYGALYNWSQVYGYSNEEIDDLNICPAGWHVPSDEDWKQMEMYLGMSLDEVDLVNHFRGKDVGGKLKGTGFTYWNSPNTGATNESGFNALPGGLRNWVDGEFINSGSTPWAGGFFWTSTRVGNSYTSALHRHLVSSRTSVFRGESEVGSYYSIRCVQDNP